MKWNKYAFSLLLVAMPSGSITADTIAAAADTIAAEQPLASRYEQRTERYRRHWAALIPSQLVIQNAGNMGAVSLGVGWSYGKHGKWETQLLWGIIPRHESSRAKLTMTLKQNFLPWAIDIGRGFSLQPLECSLYLNTVYGHEFWRSQPRRYPDGYYELMSTKFRLNAALGQQLTWHIPHNRRRFCQSVTLFYELSTCDLYVRAKVLEPTIPLRDIIGLSLGVKLQTL